MTTEPFDRTTSQTGRVARLLVTALAAVVLGAGCGVVDTDRLSGEPAPVSPATTRATASDAAAAPVTTTPPPLTTLPPTTALLVLDPTFAAIAERTTMTPEARQLLAGSDPRLVDVATLADTCTLDPELSVLGCFRPGEIAVLDVTDPRLDGMVETTTAHEMLHAVWITLDDAERDRLAGLLQEVYARVATPELTKRMDAYRARDPEVIDTELHSILGTEVADVGPDLETYYQRWFTDRSAVVTLAAAAQSTLEGLRAEVDAKDAELEALRTSINTDEQTLDAQRAALEAQLNDLNALRDAGSIEEYNAGVGPFNDQVAAYNQAVADHEALVDRHNQLVAERNAAAAAYTELVGQIDTSARTLPGG